VSHNSGGAGRGSLDRSVQPPLLYPAYASTERRAPKERLVPLAPGPAERSGPVFGEGEVRALDRDLTRNAIRNGEVIGERILVTGRVLDEGGRPVPGALVEVWQANAAGRYAHARDEHPAPLDPNFTGTGRCLTDDNGRYRFTTIRPGAYPWKNHPNAWRPAHIHFSLIGRNFLARLVTQMYFPGDPLLPLDPIYNATPDPKGRERLVAHYDHEVTRPEWALGYTFDVVLAGGRKTPFERECP